MPFEMYSGDTKHLIVSITDKDGPVNLSGSTIVWTMGELIKSLGGGIQVTGEGEVTVYLDPIDTVNVSGLKAYKLIVTDVSGNVSTVLADNIYIKR